MVAEPFIKLPVWLARRRDVGSSAKLVWAVIADRIRGKDHAWPGVTTLMRDTGLTRHTVLDAIADLERTRLLLVDRPGAGKCNRYRLQTSAESAPVFSEEWVTTESPNQCRKRTQGSAESAPELVQKAHCKQREPLNRETPPNPPKGGNRVSVPGGQTAEGKPDGPAPPRQRKRMTKFEQTVESFRLRGIEERRKVAEAKATPEPTDDAR